MQKIKNLKVDPQSNLHINAGVNLLCATVSFYCSFLLENVQN